MPSKILITGSRHFVALKEARRLKSAGHEVYTADSVNFDYTMYSRAVKRYFKVPSVRFAEDEYIEAICKIVNENSIDEVVVLGEETFYLAKNIKKIRRLCPKVLVNIDNLDTLTRLHSKWTFHLLASSLQLPIPRTALVKTHSDATKWRERWAKRVVLKPVYSRFGHQVVDVELGDKIKPSVLDYKANGGYIVQEYIEGEPISSFSLSNNDDVIVYKSVFSTNEPGAMAAAKRIDTPELVREIDAKIRKKLNYHGQLGLDFLLTSNNDLILIEANPRATVGRILMQQSKIQFRIMMLHQFLGGLVPRQAWLKYFWVMITYPDAVWSWRDIGPAFMSQIASKGLGTYLKFLKKHPGVSFQSYSTFDMEYNGEQSEPHLAERPTKSDDSAIKALIESLSLNGLFNLIYTRRPSPLQSFNHDGVRLGVIRDGLGSLAYMCACADGDYYINGEPSNLGYLSAVRKNPVRLQPIDWRLAFYKYFGNDAYFFSVLKSNTRAIQAFTRSHPLLKPPRLVTDYKVMIINAHRVKKPHSIRCEFEKATDINRTELLEFINREGSKNNLFPVVTEHLLKKIGVTESNSYVLLRDSKIVGFAGLVDQRKWKQFIVVHYASVLRYARIPFNLFARRFKYIPIPKQSTTINCPTVTLAITKGNNRDLYAELLYGIANESSKKTDIFSMAASTNCPFYDLLQTRYNLSIENRLYIQDITGVIVLDKRPIYVDALMLY